MTIPGTPEIVGPDELLSRYILQSKHVRKESNTVKADAFIPHPREDLSVTRNLELGQEEIWALGSSVAAERGKTLYGRAEVQAMKFIEQQLRVLSAPVPHNPNHANVSGWPVDKPSQKMIALEIAAVSEYIARQV